MDIDNHIYYKEISLETPLTYKEFHRKLNILPHYLHVSVCNKKSAMHQSLSLQARWALYSYCVKNKIDLKYIHRQRNLKIKSKEYISSDYSISYYQNTVAIALNTRGQIGVDMEGGTLPQSRHTKILNYIPKTIKLKHNLLHIENALKAWTVYESLLKAEGLPLFSKVGKDQGWKFYFKVEKNKTTSLCYKIG